MKKIISIMMIAAMCCAFTACKNDDDNDSKSNSSQQSSTSAKKPSEKAAELLNSVTFPEMVSKDMEFAEYTLGITADMVSEHVLYVCGSGAMPDEFGIFVAKNADTANEIREKIFNRIDYQRDTYATYSPDEAYKLTDCFCDVDGNTVIYAICADNSKARGILK